MGFESFSYKVRAIKGTITLGTIITGYFSAIKRYEGNELVIGS